MIAQLSRGVQNPLVFMFRPLYVTARGSAQTRSGDVSQRNSTVQIVEILQFFVKLVFILPES